MCYHRFAFSPLNVRLYSLTIHCRFVCIISTFISECFLDPRVVPDVVLSALGLLAALLCSPSANAGVKPSAAPAVMAGLQQARSVRLPMYVSEYVRVCVCVCVCMRPAQFMILFCSHATLTIDNSS
jgi:hypothetical protein